MSLNKKTLGFVFALIIAVVIVAVTWHIRPQGNDENQVVVAIVSSLTGGLADNGKDMANGAQMAFDEATVKGLRGGLSLKVKIFDDQSEPRTAASVAARVSQDKRIVAVVGHLSSGSTLAAIPIYQREGMAVVMPVPTNPKLTESGYNNVFRVPPRDDEQAPFLASYLLNSLPGARVAIVHDRTAYGKGFAEEFKTAFEGGNGKIVAFEGAQVEERDFRTLITKLRELGPTHILLGATYDMGAPFVRQMKELGLEAQTLCGDGCYGQAFLDQAGKAAEGTIVSFIAPPRDSSSTVRNFFERYEQKFGRVVSFAPLGYDAAKVVVEVLSTAKSLTRNGVLETLRSAGFSVQGVTGSIKFGPNGDNESSRLYLYAVRDGQWVNLK